ncbi:MAG: hypothetical protein WD226_07310 [Planctomycetota bacterium]
MASVLGINAVFHNLAAALVGISLTAAEEERSRRPDQVDALHRRTERLLTLARAEAPRVTR